MRTKEYSEFAFAIDLVMEEHKISNPILIAEKIEQDLEMEISIDEISNYLELKSEDWELKSMKQEYYNLIY